MDTSFSSRPRSFGSLEHAETFDDPRIPAIGQVSQALRFFRLGWVNAERELQGVPAVPSDYVARIGQSVTLIDVRSADELTGPLGHLPGSIWNEGGELSGIWESLPRDTPLVFVSGHGMRSRLITKRFLKRGFVLAAHLEGGITEWRHRGFETTRRAETLQKPFRACIDFGEPTKSAAVSVADIERHLGDPSDLHWTKAASLFLTGRLSCVDGRDALAIVGTPGGDAGELVLMLAALENLRGKPLSEREIDEAVWLRLDQLGRFYLHSDVTSSNSLIAALGADRRLDAALDGIHETVHWQSFMSSPPAAVREYVLEHLLADGHLGCGHLRFAMQRSAEYGYRQGLAAHVIKGFFRALWSGGAEPEFHVLPGGHSENAVLRINLTGGLEGFAALPMVSPRSQTMQAFTVHTDIARFMRGRFVRALRHAGWLGNAEIAPLGTEMDRLADLGTERTLAALATGLPIFDVDFTAHDRYEVRSAGIVGGA